LALCSFSRTHSFQFVFTVRVYFYIYVFVLLHSPANSNPLLYSHNTQSPSPISHTIQHLPCSDYSGRVLRVVGGLDSAGLLHGECHLYCSNWLAARSGRMSDKCGERSPQSTSSSGSFVHVLSLLSFPRPNDLPHRTRVQQVIQNQTMTLRCVLTPVAICQ
jgi:hypothetical protein